MQILMNTCLVISVFEYSKPSIKTFLKKDVTSSDSNWNTKTCGKYDNSPPTSLFHSNAHANPHIFSCTLEYLIKERLSFLIF